MAEQEINPARYRDLSAPFGDYEAAEKALDDFHEEVKSARVRHRIADVQIAASVPYLSAEGEETNTIVTAHLGDPLKELHLAAYAYGSARSRYDETIDVMASPRKRTRRN